MIGCNETSWSPNLPMLLILHWFFWTSLTTDNSIMSHSHLWGMEVHYDFTIILPLRFKSFSVMWTGNSITELLHFGQLYVVSQTPIIIKSHPEYLVHYTQEIPLFKTHLTKQKHCCLSFIPTYKMYFTKNCGSIVEDFTKQNAHNVKYNSLWWILNRRKEVED